jgi:hypothetical protein
MSRKFTHKQLTDVTMNREQIRMIEDEWNRRYNLPSKISGLFIPRN